MVHIGDEVDDRIELELSSKSTIGVISSSRAERLPHFKCKIRLFVFRIAAAASKIVT